MRATALPSVVAAAAAAVLMICAAAYVIYVFVLCVQEVGAGTRATLREREFGNRTRVCGAVVQLRWRRR